MDYQQQRKNRSDATRRAILDAAAKLIQEQEFDKMTVRDICARAGVTTGAFYHHFASKDELLSQGFATLDDYLEEAMADRMGLPPALRLEALLKAYAGRVEELGWRTMALYYQRRLSSPSAAAISPDRFTLRTMERCFEELTATGALVPGHAPRQLTEFCFRYFRGVVVDWILHQGDYHLTAKLEADFALFADALDRSRQGTK